MRVYKTALTGVVTIALACCLSLPAFAGINVNINIGSVAAPAPAPAQKGPPPWAPAHGKRAKYNYEYHPNAQCYFDPVRATWFFLEANKWVVRASLPDHLRLLLGGPIALAMDLDKPYLHHDDVRLRHPGKGHVKSKNKSSGKANHKGNGKGKGKKK